ncbi:MAG: hypothetical protein AAFS06_18635, partial [Cyanobacteria bacterium J06631_12]
GFAIGDYGSGLPCQPALSCRTPNGSTQACFEKRSQTGGRKVAFGVAWDGGRRHPQPPTQV